MLVQTGGSDNTIGGTTAAAANLISYNKVNGVELKSAGDRNLVEGDTAYGNGTGQTWNAGVYILDSPETTVSGCKINDNLGWGIVLTGASSGSSIISTTHPNTVLDNELGDIAY